MTTYHDEDKIEELHEKYCIINERYQYEISYKNLFDAMKEYGDYIREKTIQECIGCVSEEKAVKKLTTHEQSWYKTQGFNECREQTINNIKELLN